MAGRIIRTSKVEWIFQIVNNVVMVLLIMSVVMPFLHILALSLNNGIDAIRGGIYFVPRAFTFSNYNEVFTNSNVINAYGITIFRTVTGTLLSLFFSSMAAFALKSKTLPGKNGITMMIFFTSLFSGGLIPFYILLRSLELLDTVWVFIIPSIYSTWNIIIMRTFFNNIDVGIEESGKIDGCNEFSLLFRIILPLSKPVLAVVGLFVAVGHWNDWFSGAFFVRKQNLVPIQTLLQQMLMSQEALDRIIKESGGASGYIFKRQVTGESLKMATIIVATAPIVCVYPFIQRYFVKGFMIGAVKG